MLFMKKYHIRICALCAALLMLAGCGGNSAAATKIKQYKEPEVSDLSSGTVAENSLYKLNWDDEKKSVSLEEKATGLVWKILPEAEGGVQYDEFGLPIMQNPKLSSDILVKYYDTEDLETRGLLLEIDSYTGAVAGGEVSCEKIENGVRVTYYFTDEEFSVPVEYTITENGLAATLDPAGITENTKKIYSVSIAPFLCSVANEATDSYLFIPSGSGAISYPTTVSEAGITYSKNVYGVDPMVEVRESNPDEQQVYLPVYGAKNGNTGVCAVITEGAESASIDATYGAASYGRSAVYTTFKIKGYSYVRITHFNEWAASDNNFYTDDVIEGKCSVSFTPLTGENASYSGMADVARKLWLGNDAKSGAADADLNLIIYGGIQCEKSFLGVPYTSIFDATTVEQAEKIVRELKSETKASLSVLLRGYGSNGLDVGGDFKIGSGLGSVSELKELNSYCKEAGIDSYFDFELTRKAASGWFSFIGSARAVNDQTVYQYLYNKSTNDRINDTRYAMVARDKLVGKAEKMLKKTNKWELPGISLGSLGMVSYSDGTDIKYASRGNMPEDAVSMINSVKESGKKAAVLGGNLYTALNADKVFEVPSRSSDESFFTEDVPFYQMVFKGYVPMSSEAVNLSGDRTYSVLQAIESGTGLTYGLYYNYGSELTDSYYPEFITGEYEKIKAGIIEEVNGLSEYYSAVCGASIIKHEILGNGLRRTVFDNGVEVYVNYTDGEISSPYGTVSGHNYLLKTP